MIFLSKQQFCNVPNCKSVCLSQDDLPEVDTPLGRARGVWKTSLEGRNYAAFEGIPYAKPPEKKLRFEVSKNKCSNFSFVNVTI